MDVFDEPASFGYLTLAMIPVLVASQLGRPGVGRSGGRAASAAAVDRGGRVHPEDDRVLPLERAAEALAALERRETVGKVLLVP